MHVEIKHSFRERQELYNFRGIPTEYKLTDFVLSESRTLFFDRISRQIFSHFKYENNTITNALPKVDFKFEAGLANENSIGSVFKNHSFKSGLWRVIENKLDNLTDPFNEGDYFKIGTQVIEVSRILNESQIIDEITNLEKKSNLKENEPVQTSILSQESNNLHHCRICTEGPQTKNPLIFNICNCKSSSIHFDCLSQWITQKAFINQYKTMRYYDLSNLQCEICHEKISSMLELDGKKLDLVQPKLEKSKAVIILKLLIVNSDEYQGMLVINIEDSNNSRIKVGRSPECDVILRESSVSLHHGFFVYSGNTFYLVDSSSKFGCVKLVEKPIPIFGCNNKSFVIHNFKIRLHVFQKGKKCECFQIKGRKMIINPIHGAGFLFEKDNTKKESQVKFEERKSASFYYGPEVVGKNKVDVLDRKKDLERVSTKALDTSVNLAHSNNGIGAELIAQHQRFNINPSTNNTEIQSNNQFLTIENNQNGDKKYEQIKSQEKVLNQSHQMPIVPQYNVKLSIPKLQERDQIVR